MTGFMTRIKTSSTLNGDYRVVSTHKDNIGYTSGSNLMQYIKLAIDIPADKIINSIDIYIEYKSTKDAAPKEVQVYSGTFISEILDTHYTSNYKVKGIDIDTISNINDVTIQIRGAKENYDGEVWTDWKTITLDGNLNVSDTVTFGGYRFFQARITLLNRNAYVKLNYIDLGVI
jgi:hypothetical protein